MDLLSILIFVPIIGAVIVYFAGLKSEKLSRILTILISAAITVIVTGLLVTLNWSNGSLQLTESYNWYSDFGLTYAVGVDGISLPLLIISGLLTTLAAAGSWSRITSRVKEYNALMLLFEGAVIGVFTSLNLITFYIFWEITLIPMFLFIGFWGGPLRKYAAMKFLIMTHIGSVFVLLGFIGLYAFSTPHTFVLTDLTKLHLPLTVQILISIAFFIGFGVKLPIVPLHTWLPDAYVEAPAPVSMLLAGLLAKMGGYGFIRMNIFLLPDASRILAPVFIAFAVLTMFYGAIVAITQQDFKRMVAFTSINHVGYILLGAFTLTSVGMSGAIFQMFNHANVISALFLISGVLPYRMGTRNITELLSLGRAMPKTAFLLILSSLAAMGFPGFSNFISEYTVILAGISFNTILAATVLVPGITAGYFMWMLRRVLMRAGKGPEVKADASLQILLIITALIVPLIILGLYPSPLLSAIIPSARTMLR